MSLTDEQQYVVEVMLSSKSNNRIVAVNSVAGSGKTTTAVAVESSLKPLNGIYTAFNKAIVEDSRKRFKSITAKTMHAIAYSYTKPKHGIKNFNYESIIENIKYTEKHAVADILDSFYRSNELDIHKYIDIYVEAEYKHLRGIIASYADKMLNDEIPITFNFMLKYLHALLVDKKIVIECDLFIFDEVQDVTAVTLEIFKHVSAKKKIMFGDTYQNIYSFMDTVNAFNLLTNTIDLNLTQSFRCIPEIALRIENYGKEYLNPNFKFKGTQLSNDNIITESHISKTNSSLISLMHNFHEQDKGYKLTRSIVDIFNFPINLFLASRRNKSVSFNYQYLVKAYDEYEKHRDTYNSYFSYLENVFSNDEALLNTIKLLTNLQRRNINIFDVQKTAKTWKKDNNMILSTSHAFKGLETDRVNILEDLNNSVSSIQHDYSIWKSTVEEYGNNNNKIVKPQIFIDTFNTYYVAISRAKYELLNAVYA